MILNVVSEKTLESHLDCKEIKPDNPKGNQLWMFTGRTDAEAETPILWPPDTKSQLIRRDPDARKDWMQEKGATDEEMVGWRCRFDGHEFEQAAGDGGGQGSLACCSPWGRKEWDTTEWLNNNNQGLNPRRLHWESGPPRRSLNSPCLQTLSLSWHVHSIYFPLHFCFLF